VTFKVIELVVILGALWLLWRHASKIGAEAAEQKAREAEEAAARGDEDDAA
jgi:hypothetical protein